MAKHIKHNSKELQKGFAKLGNTLDKLATDSAELGSLTVEIGLPDDRIHNPSGMILSQVGAIHEFGLGDIPERSFLRGSVMAARSDIRSKLQIVTEKVLNGTAPLVAMEQLAVWGQGMVQEYMKNGKSNFTPLDQSTIARRKKKSDNPLNDTGELIQGVIGVVVSD